MAIFDKNSGFKSVIEIDEDDLKDANLSVADFVDKKNKKRAFVDVLGARLAMKMLFEQKIEANNLYSLYSIQSVLEEFDLSDIYLDGIKIDVRLVFNRNEIFIPKTHFEYDLLPDVYLVLQLQKDSPSAEVLGFFEPKNLNKQNASKNFYFYEYDKLTAPDKFKDFLANYVVERNFDISENNQKAEELLLSLVDKEISEADKRFLLKQLANDVDLREKAVEFENFEAISKQVAKGNALLNSQVLEIVGAQKLYSEDELSQELSKDEVKKDSSGGSSVVAAAAIGVVAGAVAGTVTGAVAATGAMAAGAAIASETAKLGAVSAAASTVDAVLSAVAAGSGHDILPEIETKEEDLFKIEDDGFDVQENDLSELDIDAVEHEEKLAVFDDFKVEETVDDININQALPEMAEPEDYFGDLGELTPLEELKPIESDLMAIDLSETDLVIEEEPKTEVSSDDVINLEDFDFDILNDDPEEEEEQEAVQEEDLSVVSEHDEEAEEELEIEPEPELEIEDAVEMDAVEEVSDAELEPEIEEEPEVAEVEEEFEPEIIEEAEPEFEEEPEEVDEIELEEEPEIELDQEFEEDSELQVVSFDEIIEKEKEFDPQKIASDVSEELLEDDDDDNYAPETETNDEIYLEEDEIEEIETQEKHTDDVLSQVDNLLNDDDLLSGVELDEEQQKIFEDDSELSFEETTQNADAFNYADLDLQEEDDLLESKNENENLQVLFQNGNVNGEQFAPESEFDVGEGSPLLYSKQSGNRNNKKIMIAASLAGVVLISLVAGQVLKPKSADLGLKSDTPPIEASSDTLPQADSTELTPEEAQEGVQADFQNNDLDAPAKPAAKADGKTAEAQQPRDMNKAVSDIFLSEPVNTSISKVGWEVPEDLAYNDSFRRYLQMAGRNLKLNLQNNLLLATEMAYSNKVIVDLSIGKNGDLKSSNISVSSGSKQIDNIVLQSVKETLKYLKVPASEISGDSFAATLIINF